jgi:hypothetical protein
VSSTFRSLVGEDVVGFRMTENKSHSPHVRSVNTAVCSTVETLLPDEVSRALRLLRRLNRGPGIAPEALTALRQILRPNVQLSQRCPMGSTITRWVFHSG